jgi:Zn finger protein HypA/HybF involved in hydrogenase expression
MVKETFRTGHSEKYSEYELQCKECNHKGRYKGGYIGRCPMCASYKVTINWIAFAKEAVCA